MVFLFCLLFLSRLAPAFNVGYLPYLDFHFIPQKNSSILFSVREGTLILGNKTLSHKEGSSAPTEGIIILILGFKTVIGYFTCMEVIILLIFGYKTGMGSSIPTDALFCLFLVIRSARGLITQNKCTSPPTKK